MKQSTINQNGIKKDYFAEFLVPTSIRLDILHLTCYRALVIKLAKLCGKIFSNHLP